MVAELAREDYQDLIAEGLKPTLDDFERLNQLAVRLEDGAETTPANHPRLTIDKIYTPYWVANCVNKS